MSTAAKNQRDESPKDSLIGRTVGKYTLERLVGRGGMSRVYLARTLDRDEPVVVKRLHDHLVFEDHIIQRVRDGATILASIECQNVSRVLEVFEDEDRLFTVEEYLPGGSLQEILDSEEPIPERQALTWGRDILLGVDCAHRAGLIHRDPKPGNLMLDRRRQVKVTDFGIAKVIGGPRMTQWGAQLGTAEYMSPEQVRAEPSHPVDHRSDVYSMGVVLFELLCGRLPFESDNEYDIMQKQVREPPPPMSKFRPGIDRELEEIVAKALKKNPDERYAGCAEFARRIEAYLDKTPPPSIPGLQPDRRWRTVGIGAVVMLLWTGAVAFATAQLVRPTAGESVVLEGAGERAGLSGDVERLRRQLDEREAELTSVRAELASVTSEAAALRSRLDEDPESSPTSEPPPGLEQAQGRIRELQREVASARNQAASLRTQLTAVQNEKEELTGRVGQLTARLLTCP